MFDKLTDKANIL